MTMQKNINFETRVHGKWILAGEHAVLRGHPEIIFPVNTKHLNVKYTATKDPLDVQFNGKWPDESHLIFWETYERAIEILKISPNSLRGQIVIENNIPIGAGMGGSAALCVAIGRWLMSQGLVTKENIFEFSRELENLFHGESSGADIAGAIAGAGIVFSKNEGSRPIATTWQPSLYLSFSGKPSATSRCVMKVKELWKQNKALGQQIDAQMAKAVHLAESALKMDEGGGLTLLCKAIQNAHQCFKQWGLCEGMVANHIQKLLDLGAIAAKPTGSGDGGFVLSLWKSCPPNDLLQELIAVDGI